MGQNLANTLEFKLNFKIHYFHLYQEQTIIHNTRSEPGIPPTRSYQAPGSPIKNYEIYTVE